MDENLSEQPPISRLSAFLALFAVAIFACNVALVAMDVTMRWLLRDPQSWVSDIQELTYPVALAACFPPALEGGAMIVIRLFDALPDKRLARLFDSVGQLAMAALLFVLAWKVFERAMSDWKAGFATVLLHVPVAPTWFAVAAILAVAAIIQTHRALLITAGRIQNV